MAADVSSLVRILSRYKDDRTVVNDSARPRSTMGLMTRDLLGSGGYGEGDGNQSLELDLDLHVPNGWEKRLDLKSGKVYLQQQCNSTNSSSSTHHHHTEESNHTIPRLQDLNFPPISGKSPTKPLLSLFDENDKSLELKLDTSSSSPPPLPPSSSSSSNHSLSYFSSLSVSSANSSLQSVCTLDKVKSALERAEKNIKKRQSPDDGGGFCRQTASAATNATSPVAAGCPECLSYVLVTNNNPKCPRCHSFVPLPSASIKKPKIDLNMSI